MPFFFFFFPGIRIKGRSKLNSMTGIISVFYLFLFSSLFYVVAHPAVFSRELVNESIICSVSSSFSKKVRKIKAILLGCVNSLILHVNPI